MHDNIAYQGSFMEEVGMENGALIKGRLAVGCLLLVLAPVFVAVIGDVPQSDLVGSIVRFSGGVTVPKESESFHYHALKASDRSECILALKDLSLQGGSFIVEEYAPARKDTPFRAHWTGGSTSAAPSDCGHDSDLYVSSVTLRSLASSVGGFGNRLND